MRDIRVLLGRRRGVRLHGINDGDGMRIRLCHNGDRTSCRIPVTRQQSQRVVAVGQPLAHTLGTGRVDANHTQRWSGHARTVAPTARRYSASASSAT